MKWVTRANVKVDRVACPWLIRTFVDRDAEFLFVPGGEVEAVARKSGAIPYDVAGVELGHHGEECSFDAIVKKYNVKDEAIGRVALIVRGADTPRRDLTPESPGLEAIAEGFKRLAAADGYDDHETMRRERHLYDALYLYCGCDPKKLRRDGPRRALIFVKPRWFVCTARPCRRRYATQEVDDTYVAPACALDTVSPV